MDFPLAIQETLAIYLFNSFASLHSITNMYISYAVLVLVLVCNYLRDAAMFLVIKLNKAILVNNVRLLLHINYMHTRYIIFKILI